MSADLLQAFNDKYADGTRPRDARALALGGDDHNNNNNIHNNHHTEDAEALWAAYVALKDDSRRLMCENAALEMSLAGVSDALRRRPYHAPSAAAAGGGSLPPSRPAAADTAAAQRERELVAGEVATQILAAAPQTRLANAGVVGLLGFGMTTILLNLVNTGHYPLMTAVPAIGICFGGGAQFIAGILEFLKGNTFGFVAFGSYGAFWTALVCLWMLPNSTMYPGAEVNATTDYMVGVFMLIWAIFSFMMMICTLRMNVAIFLLFLTLVLLFLLLAGGNMAGNNTAVKAAGYEGIVCGAIALYLAFAEIMNEVWDRTILPIGPFGGILEVLCGSHKENNKKKNGGDDRDSEAIDDAAPTKEAESN